MSLLIFLVVQVSSVSVKSIPSTGPPPVSNLASAAVYDSKTGNIITIGGQQSKSDLLTSEVNIFNIKSKSWESAEIISEFSPSYLVNHGMYLRKDRKILIIGRYSEVFLFDIDYFSWSTEELKGDNIGGVRSYSSTQVVFNETEYFVIFGGINPNGFTNDLFLIDVERLECRKLPNNGIVPSPRNMATISFYDNSFYVYGYATYDLARRVASGTELFRYDLRREFWDIVKTQGLNPGPRSVHYSCIYLEELYIIYGLMPEYSYEYDSIFKFNFRSGNWSFVAKNPGHKGFLSASILIEEKFYFLYGRSFSSYTNAVSFIDLSKPHLLPEYISPNWISPSARVNHCSFIVNENMYIFGGSNGDSSSNKEFYNDMWSFNFNYENWTTIKPFGEVPSERSNFCSVIFSGDVLALFGGVGPSGYLNDLYYFQETSQKWTQVKPENSGPSGRSGCCMAYGEDKLFIVGGKNEDSGFNEIWIFNLITNDFYLSEVKIGGSSFFQIQDIIDSICWIESENDYLKLSLVGGVDSVAYPNLNLIEVKFFQNSTFNISKFNISDFRSQGVVGTDTSLIRTGKYGVRLGGTVFTWMVFSNVYLFDFQEKTLTPLNLTEKFNFFGHSAVHFQKSVYVFGGGTSNEIYKSFTKFKARMLKIEFEKKDNFTLTCSHGTSGSECQPCRPGTYAGEGVCEKCPKGKYNRLFTATSIEQCLPCPAGYFTNKEGSSFCYQCESMFSCPIGTVTPKGLMGVKGNSSVQPKVYQDQREIVHGIVLKLWYSAAGVCAIVCVFSIGLGIFWDQIRKIDFFVSNHHNDLGVAIVHRKTSFGGLFSLFFVMVSIVTISGGFLSFYLDNISEIQALVPLISLDTSVQANFLRFEFLFYSYGGNCVEKSECSSKIKVFQDGLSSASRYIECSFIEDECKVTVNYLSSSIKRKNAEVFLSLEEQSSYATGLSLNISASSSIPNEISSVFVAFQTSSESLLLKGTTPSIFYYKFTPSVFKSESNQWPSQETGYHIWSSQDPQIGSQVDQESMKLKLHLKAKVIITESDTALMTKRYLNQTWLLFIGTILGSVFGLMGTVAAIMRITENFSEKIEKRKFIKKNIKDNVVKNISLLNEFYPGVEKKTFCKIVPLKYEIHETQDVSKINN